VDLAAGPAFPQVSSSAVCSWMTVIDCWSPSDRARIGHAYRSLGYEHYDAHLCRLRLSLDVALAWADGYADVAPRPRCIRRSALSRVVSFTDPFTKAPRRQVAMHVGVSLGAADRGTLAVGCW